MKNLILIVLLIFMGCSNKITLTDNAQRNNEILKSYIPQGTPVNKAESLMEKNGFKCTIYKNTTINLQKSTTSIGEIKGDFLYCDKQEKKMVGRRWQVIFIIEAEKIKDCSVSTGLIGP